MEKNIIELLKNNNRVIIPKLGAFIKKQVGGNETITFNQFLKFDDGLLVNHVAEKEKIEKEEAKKKIQGFVEKINKELGDGNQFKVGDLGNIYKDANGKIQFIEKSKTIESKAPAAEQKTKPAAKPETTTKEQPKTESKQTETTKKTEVKEEKKEATQKEPPKSQTTKTQTTVRQEQSKPSTGGTSKTYTQAQSTKTKQTSRATPPPPSKPSKSSGSNNTKYILWSILLLVLIGLGIYFLLNRDMAGEDKAKREDFADSLEMAKEKIQEEEQTLEEGYKAAAGDTTAAMLEETAEPTNEPADMMQETKKQISAQKVYIVAGAFKYEKNANEYVRTLKNMGYNAEIIGVVRGLHYVSYETHNSYDQAKSAMKNIRRKMGSDKAWLYYNK